jgi:hypothetical protein
MILRTLIGTMTKHLNAKSLDTNKTATRALVDLCVPACVFKLLMFPV